MFCTILVCTFLAACTDNGDSGAHGPTFGAIPKSDGSLLGPDGEVLPSDGGFEIDGAKAPDSGEGQDAQQPSPCTNGSIAVVAGDDATLSAATQEKGGAWSTQAIAGGAAKDKPALVAFGVGFLGMAHGPGDVLQTFSSGALGAMPTMWSTATTIGTAGVKGSPALAVVGTKAHVVYSTGSGAKTDFTHGIHDGTGWNAASAAVGPPPSFGTVSAGLAAAGTTDVAFAENGTNHGLYTRTFAAGTSTWSVSDALVGAGTVGADVPATPELVAIDGGGPAIDLLLVYVEQTTRRLSFATRDATSKAWTNGGNIHLNATTAEKLSVARVGAFTVLVAFRGQDQKAYYAQGTITGGASVSWTAALPIGGGAAFAVDSTPAVAKGVCGDDAIASYASGGVVRVTRLRGVTWTQPETIAGVAGSRVAIATK